MISENYLDPDVGYLLGLITARGQLSSRGSHPIISIDFPHRSLQAKGVKISYDQEHHMHHNLLLIKERLSGVLGHTIEHVMSRGRGTIVIDFPGRPMTYRNLVYILGENITPKTSRVPTAIFSAPSEIQREFARGFADSAGFIRPSNANRQKIHRVYFQIPNANWALPIDFCKLLQVHLGIPVDSIQWGHPNIRTPHDLETHSWTKEHQIRVFAQDFIRVGFHVEYKDEILKELAAANPLGSSSKICNPNRSIRRIKRKPKHPDEKSKKLPLKIRNHFNAYWEICLGLGCKQCTQVEGESEEMFIDDES